MYVCGQSECVLQWPLPNVLEKAEEPFSSRRGSVCEGGVGGLEMKLHPCGGTKTHSSLLGVPGPQPPFPCNKEGTMLFLLLYLPRVPMIFFLSESNFLLTFLPDVAKHDLCKRTWLAACFLPGAPQNSWKALCLFLSRKGARLPGVPGPVLPLGCLVPNRSLSHQRCASSAACFSRLSEREVPAGCQGSEF